MPWPLEKIPLCRNNFNLFLKMKSVSAKPGACQLSWRAWARDTENYLEEMPWPLEKAALCRNNFNFFLKMNSMSAEPGPGKRNRKSPGRDALATGKKV